MCKSTEVYGCTAIGVDLESCWVGSRDVSDPSLIRAWGEWDYCCFKLFEAAITWFIGSSRGFEYYVRNEGIHGGFLIPNASQSTSFLHALWLTDNPKVVLLAICPTCLAPCWAHPWPITWSSSTMLVTTTAFIRILPRSRLSHSPFVSVGSSRSGHILCLPLLTICWHLQTCHVRNTRYFILVSHGHFKCFSMAYILL